MPIAAADFAFTGAFTKDDDQKSFYFTLLKAGAVALSTSSYAAGGFDPSLALFDAGGNLIANNRDGGCANVAPNLATGYCWDAYLAVQLPAGTYQAVLTQSANVANGPTLASAFAYTGAGNFTIGPESNGAGGFWDLTGVQVSPSFALGVRAVDSAAAQIVVSPGALPSGTLGAAYSSQLAATGGTQPESWTISAGSLPPGIALSADGLLSGTPTALGTYSFTAQVADSSSIQMTAAQAMQISIVPQKLQITSSSLQTWVAGSAFSGTLAATGGYPPYSWSLNAGATGGLAIGPDGVLSGTPGVAGTFTIPAQVTDSQNNVSQVQLTWQVNPRLQITSSANLPPGITGRAYPAFTLAAAGGASATDVWSVASGSAPPGITVSAAGSVQGTANTRGTYAFTVQATDGVQPARQAVSLSVYDPLAITTPSLVSGVSGSAYGPVGLAASGGSGSYAWSSPNLPAGFALSTGGVLSGSPQGGTSGVTFNLTDATAAQTASVMLQIVIGYPSLTISTSGATGGVAEGAAVSQSFTASGGKPPYTWSGSGLPPGLSIDSTGLLSGTASQAGNFTFSVQVTDSLGDSASIGGSLAVLGFTTTSLPSATTVAAYSQSFGAAGGVPPYSFSAQGVPAGLSLSGAGLLSGIAKAAGTYSLTVQVADSAGNTIKSAFTLTVASPSTLTVSGASLLSGAVNTPYSDTLAANGGAPSYTWAIIGGALPTGLSAGPAGTVSGTPTTPGTFTFTAQATDATGGRASGVVSIVIAPMPLTLISSSSLPNGIAGADYFAQVLTPAGGVAPYTFSISGGALPDGLSLSNGQIIGTPTARGAFTFQVSAQDSSIPPSSVSTGLAILVRPAQSDLLLSAASASFSLQAGAAGVPPPASVPIRSSVVAQLLNYSVQTVPAVAWLDVSGDVSGGGSTPGSISIGLNASALTLQAAAAPYQTTVIVACVSPSPCAGNTQTIGVSLTVSAPPPQLTIANSLLSFAFTAPGTATQTFGLQNSGGGSIGIQSASAADGWLTVSGVPGSLSPAQAADVIATVGTEGLTPGFYRSTIAITSSAGNATVPVTLLYSRSNSLNLNPAGVQFTAQQGGVPGNPGGSFSLNAAGVGTVNFTAAVMPGAPWLTLATPSGSATSVSPGQVSFSIDPAVTSTLAPAAYYGLIEITSGDVYNSPQDFEVVLNVVPVTDPVKPDPEPAGLLFISTSAAALQPQTVQVFTSSTAGTAFQASASTVDGANWLSASPATGTASSTAPGSTQITANAAGLAPGVYRGGVAYAFSSAAVRTVNVTLIVGATPAAGHDVTPKPAGNATTSSCSSTTLVPTQTGLVNYFAQPAAWPTPLSIELVDNCGSAVGSGQVVATFSNGDPPLPLSLTNAGSGIYSGTWTPRSPSSQVTISARASAPGFTAATAQITGQVNPNQAPLLTPGATLHVFDPLVGGSLGPGNIVQIYGSYLAAQTLLAPSIPLPVTLGGTSVLIGGVQAPLYFVSAGQINAQVPFELTAGKQYQILIAANGAFTTPDRVQLTDVSPGIAAFASGGIIAQHLDGSLISETAPAKPSEIIVFYMAGLGDTDHPVVSGAASPGTVLARPLTIPALELNGEPVPILFGGLTPGLVGLYQVNFQVPADAVDGDLALVVSQGTSQSNQTILPVHK